MRQNHNKQTAWNPVAWQKNAEYYPNKLEIEYNIQDTRTKKMRKTSEKRNLEQVLKESGDLLNQLGEIEGKEQVEKNDQGRKDDLSNNKKRYANKMGTKNTQHLLNLGIILVLLPWAIIGIKTQINKSKNNPNNENQRQNTEEESGQKNKGTASKLIDNKIIQSAGVERLERPGLWLSKVKWIQPESKTRKLLSFRVYCPTEMLRDVSDGKWGQAQKLSKIENTNLIYPTGAPQLAYKQACGPK